MGNGEEKNGETASGRQDRATVRSVERAFDILGCFSTEQRTITLTEAARTVGLPLSTAARLLGTLEASQFIRRLPDGRYMPGGKLLRVGVVALHGVELYDVAGEYLERLAEFSGESANLAIPIGDEQVLYVRQIPSRHTVRHDNWIGKSVPVEGTAIGEAAIGLVGADGYAFRNTTLEPDVTAIAAPVIGPDGRIVASFSVTVPSYRVDHGFAKRVGARLVREAWNMSEQLGAPSAMKPGVLAS